LSSSFNFLSKLIDSRGIFFESNSFVSNSTLVASVIQVSFLLSSIMEALFAKTGDCFSEFRFEDNPSEPSEPVSILLLSSISSRVLSFAPDNSFIRLTKVVRSLKKIYEI